MYTVEVWITDAEDPVVCLPFSCQKVSANFGWYSHNQQLILIRLFTKFLLVKTSAGCLPSSKKHTSASRTRLDFVKFSLLR